MKRFIVMVLAAALLLSGCSQKSDIVGVWEQEMTISVLGVQGQTEAEAIARFTFRKDGTGKQEVIIPDGSHRDTGREFTYTLEEDALTLNYGENQTETFTAVLEKDTLQMNNQRGQYKLTRAAR